MVEVATANRLELLHVHYAIPFSPAAILARQMAPELNLKVVTTLHGTDTTLVGAAPYFHPVTRFSIEQSDAVTTVSQYLREETIETFQVRRAIVVIPNCVDLEHYRRAHDPEPGPGVGESGGSAPRRILHISNFRPVKRAADVIEIFARVRARVDAHLTLVGDGPDLSRALALARTRGVAGQVSTVGVVDDVAPFLRQTDLLLLPSASESFGLVALEAMASGVPVVASRTGGIPEVVPDGGAGYLLRPGDVDGMAARATELLTDAALHRRCSAAGRDHARRFSSALVVPQFEALYRAVLGLPAAGPAGAPGGSGG
jgi:N-acetyl-alpha-D-glucosaminyl L-malate synthase BshA